MAIKKLGKVTTAKIKKAGSSKTIIKSQPKQKKAKLAGAKRNAKTSKSKSALKASITTFITPPPDPAQVNLAKFDHIVVLMMENRSFDHMLGYLPLEGNRQEVDGLTAGMSNNDSNGKSYTVQHLSQTAFSNGEDPCHDGDCVTEQLSGNNGGFVTNFEKQPKVTDPGIVMGYYNGDDLPVYDFLAREYTICNKWFCSVDGSTWPNRLYSLAGQAAGKKVNKSIPIYDVPTFVRHLDNNQVSWRWYSHNDVPTLRMLDSNYRIGHFGRFAYFGPHTLQFSPSFLEDAASGNLASVSWIDPSFINGPFVGAANANDDHPPGDILHGQELVLKLYNAIASGPKSDKTLLIVVYDEHGGFFDHVPVAPAMDDNPDFRTYGVRVPSFIVSPYVERGSVTNLIFDHTSIIKTILLRFCTQADGSIPDMGARINSANHLGVLLTGNAPRQAPPLTKTINTIAVRRTEMFKTNLGLQATGDLPSPPPLNELQKGIIAARQKLRSTGFPEGQP